MNRYYIIVPILLMAAFVFIERNAAKDAEAAEQVKQEVILKKKADEAAKKKELEEKARIDSENRNKERVAEEERLRKKKQAEYDAKIQKMKDDIKKYTDEVDRNNKLVAQLEKDLAAKREQRENENTAVFQLAKKVEISKRLRRDAELEVQRLTTMLTNRVTDSTFTKMPVVATAATAGTADK